MQAQELVALFAINKRVCPQPHRWNELYKVFSYAAVVRKVAPPDRPLVLAAWHETPALLKAIRMRDHIHWACAHGLEDWLTDWLHRLDEGDWHHLGE